MNGCKSKMRAERVDEVLLVRYLLGNLSETEEVQVEDRAFADADYMCALETAEADLIDAYVLGGLSQSDRRAFEGRFLTSPNRWRKVEFARALAKVTTELAESTRPPVRQNVMSLIQGWSPRLRFAAAFGALVCVAAPSWLMFQNAAMRSRVAVLESERHEFERQEQALRQQLAEGQGRADALAAQRQQQQSIPIVASLVLLPGVSRSETRVEQLVLTPSAQIAHIEIQLEARDDYPQFSAGLRTRRGEEVLTWGKLQRRQTSAGYAVSMDIPASALTVGEYELSLKGVIDHQAGVDIGYYYFGVRKQ
jgi:hypothetical protein